MLTASPGDPRNEGSIPLSSIAFMVGGAEIVHRGPQQFYAWKVYR